MTYQRNDTPEPLAVGIRILFPDDIALLARAAQAAGYIEFTCRDGIGPRARAESGVGGPWNPLDDDGDAFRLLVLLRLQLRYAIDGSVVYAGTVKDFVAAYTGAAHAFVEAGDVAAAARLAIVRAAAAMAPAPPSRP